MFKTFFKHSISTHKHLMFVFTCVFAFFCDNLLMAQCHSVPGNARLNISVIDKNENDYNVAGSLSKVHPSNVYNFTVSIDEAPSDVTDVSVDFGNGQTEQINLLNGVFPIIQNYTINYSGWSSQMINVNISVSRAGNMPLIRPFSSLLERYDYARSINASTYQTPDETVTVAGINMHIKYAPSNSAHKLKKPIIFVEGIDFGKRTLCDFTGKPVKVGTFGWDTFVTGMVEDPTDSDNETFALLPEFNKEMLNAGYDIVFCDFLNGTDLIQNNGRSLIAVINEVNRRKQADAGFKNTCFTNSIVGASMGGQVVRWALKTMENESTEHDCKLYFSMDSPHKGANIPLSLQAFVKFGAEHGPEDATKQLLREKWEALNTPAPKQLLAFHLENQGENDAYLSMMTQLGYPQKTRNIASANGSGTAVNQGYGNNALLAGANGLFELGPVSAVVFNLDLFASGNNTITNFFRVLEKPSRTHLHLLTGDMKLEKQSNNSVLYSDGEKKRTVLFNGLIPTAAWDRSKTTSFSKDFTNWDNAPGGNRNDIGGEFLKAIETGLRDEGLNFSIARPGFKQAFIPTVSALDLATDDMHTNASNFIQDVNNPRNTPFKSVFISNDNEAHVFMSRGLLDFARNEIISNTNVSCRGMITADPNPNPTPIEQGPLNNGN